MRSTLFPVLLVLPGCLWLALPAAAQAVDSGLEVQVNPYAARPGSGVLLYPGGTYSRRLPPLLYPGQKSGPIQLHMPSRHRAIAHAAAPARPKAAPPPKVASAAPPPAPPPRSAAKPTIFGGNNLSNVFGNNPPAAPAPKAAPAPASKLASRAPARPAAAGEANLSKRSVILFAKDAPDPAQGALGAIKFLAGDLNTAMTGPAARVELQAYGGAKGDKGSDARRLSLKRALAIRQVLIDDGVSPERIDVRAMGGADDSGPADRVDVYVRSG
jgi:outer membrane protein OmpA-like peptidoglycan-associated protein